jgi:hypothetical protein
MILNHIKAYYHGVKSFKCPLLRGELGNKMNTFKQRMKKSNYNSKKNYLDQNISDDDSEENDIEIYSNNLDNDDRNLLKLKRKRSNNNNDDDEKENDRYHRKVIIKSTTIKNDQRMIIIKKFIDQSEVKQQENRIDNKFDHEYCDIMYDNEFEGLHLLHFSSYDVEPSEEIEDFQIQNEQITDNILEIDSKPSKNCLLVPLSIPNELG